MLEIKNLHATIGDKEILKGIDLKVSMNKMQKLAEISLERGAG